MFHYSPHMRALVTLCSHFSHSVELLFLIIVKAHWMAECCLSATQSRDRE